MTAPDYERGPIQIDGISTGVFAGEIKAGDTITIDAAPDRRSWWQRRAPPWLGGRKPPSPFSGRVTVVASNQPD